MVYSPQMAHYLESATAAMAASHYYLWRCIDRYCEVPSGWRRPVTVAIVGLAVLSVLTVPAVRLLSRDFVAPIAWAGYTWMGALLILLLCFAVLDFATLVTGRLGSPDSRATRRQFFGRLGNMAIVGGGAVGLTAFSLWDGLRPVAVKPIAVTLDKLPPELSGFRIVQLSDLHIGPTLGGDWLSEVVAQVNALQPDLIAITGDIVDGQVHQLAPQVAPLAGLSARLGVFAVTGNHEFYTQSTAAWMAHFRQLGIHVLDNEHVTLMPKAGQPGIELAGVHDLAYRSGRDFHPQFSKAVAGSNPALPLIMLSHQPSSIFNTAPLGIDLQLSGHTHGGQMFPWQFLARLQQPYISGLHRHPGSNAQIYVSSGTGFWGPPMRLGTRAEITEITLLAPAANAQDHAAQS